MLKNYYRARVNATRNSAFINRTTSTRTAFLETVAVSVVAVVFILVCAVA